MKYKKGLIAIVMACSMSLLFVGCATESTEGVTSSTTVQSRTRFVTTTDSYEINGDVYSIIYDSKTENVYLSARRLYGNDTFPLLNDIGKPVKYKELK